MKAEEDAEEALPDAAAGKAKKWLLTSTQASLIGPFVDYMGLG